MLTFGHAKRKLLTAGLSALAGLAIAGFVPWTVSSDATRAMVMARLTGAFGAQQLSAGKMSVSLLPSPRLEIHDLAMRRQDGSSLSAPATHAYLKLGPLFKGQLKPGSIAVAGPDITLVMPASEHRGLRQIAHAASHGGLLALPGSVMGIAKISVDDGRLAIRTGGGDGEVYDKLRLRLAFAAESKPLSFVFSARRNGEETHASFQGASRSAIASGTVEPISFSYWSLGLSFEFDGKGSVVGAVELSGQLIARAGVRGPAPFLPSLAGLGITSLPPLEMTATLAFNNRGANLSDLRLTADKDRFTGVGAVRHDGQRWHVSGTLAGELANLTPFATALSKSRRPDGAWTSAAVDTESLFAANIDLRLSADRLQLGERQLGRAALALMTRPNRAELTLGDAIYHDGSARFRLTAMPSSEGLDLRFAGTLDKADLGAAIGEYTRSQRFRGKGNAALTLESSGRSMAQFVANAEGRMSAALRDGELIGIDLNRLALRRGARADLMLADSLGGRTPFESATVQARISRGQALPVEGRLQGGRIVGSVGGSVDFAQGITDLSGTVVQLPAETFVVEPVPVLDFSINGPIAEPRISPNIAALLRRS